MTAHVPTAPDPSEVLAALNSAVNITTNPPADPEPRPSESGGPWKPYQLTARAVARVLGVLSGYPGFPADPKALPGQRDDLPAALWASLPLDVRRAYVRTWNALVRAEHCCRKNWDVGQVEALDLLCGAVADLSAVAGPDEVTPGAADTPAGLSRRAVRVYSEIRNAEVPPTQQEIADALRCSERTVARALDELRDRGLTTPVDGGGETVCDNHTS